MAATTTDTNPTPLDPTGWHLTFADDFNGWYVDRAAWPVVYDGPSSNGAYRWSGEGVIVYGEGELLLRNQNTPEGWIAGGIGQGWNAQTYGRYEVRAKVDPGQGTAGVIGLWPLVGTYPPEIDFLEAPTADRKIAYFTYHGEFGPAETTGFPLDVSKWHVYALDWMPGRLTYYIDGVKVCSSTPGPTSPTSR
jgi:beta-glucanase (GH16 family)